MKDDILNTVRSLIALSASDQRGEAENAAFKACKYIRQHGLIVTFPEKEKKDRGRRTKTRPADAPGEPESWCEYCRAKFPMYTHVLECARWRLYKVPGLCYSMTEVCRRCSSPIALQQAYRAYGADGLICGKCYRVVDR